MKLELFIPLMAVLATLSIAAERLLEIAKGLIPWLNRKATDTPAKEGLRRAAVQAVAVNFGCTLTVLAGEAIDPKVFGFVGTLDLRHYLICGLLVASGAALWHSILGWVVQIKDFKAAEAERVRASVRVPVSALPATPTPDAPRVVGPTTTVAPAAPRTKILVSRYGRLDTPVPTLASIGARSSARGISLILAQADGVRKREVV